MPSSTRGPHLLTALAAGTVALGIGSACGGTGKVEPVKTSIYTEPGSVAPSPNGIEFPSDYRDWSVLTVAHRVDKQSMRVVLGNEVAITAARARKTDPWPDGTVIANVVWEQLPDTDWPTSISVDQFVRVDFMMKDLESNTKNDSGWAWARWTGDDLRPYGSDENSDAECVECHKKVSDTDWVFTRPALLP